jgi:hypothetical protein
MTTIGLVIIAVLLFLLTRQIRRGSEALCNKLDELKTSVWGISRELLDLRYELKQRDVGHEPRSQPSEGAKQRSQPPEDVMTQEEARRILDEHLVMGDPKQIEAKDFLSRAEEAHDPLRNKGGA